MPPPAQYSVCRFRLNSTEPRRLQTRSLVGGGGRCPGMESYNKLRVIGKGSYGEVWLVKHRKDKKQVRVGSR